jgi:hypothetical protein
LGKSILIESDNSTSVAYVNKQGGIRSHSLYKEACLLYDWLLPRAISVLAVHRPGVDNALADSLSRDIVDSREWSLDQRVADCLFLLWGRPFLDLFASSLNHKLPLFCSRVPQGGSLVEAFSLNWGQWEIYAFPPLPLIPRVLAKVRLERASMILIAPLWSRRPWFPLLLDLSCDSPRLLPSSPRLLSQHFPQSGVLYNQDTATLRLAAWRLSGDFSKTEGFRRRLSISCSPADELPRVASMTPAGPSFIAGAVSGISIPLLLL